MAAGLPVIGSKVGETQIIIENARAGETIEFTTQEFARSVLDLLSNRNKYETYSANAASYAREHDWERLFNQWWAFVQQLELER
jgi:glycosyltransferase involved in cell wall biosynthesis